MTLLTNQPHGWQFLALLVPAIPIVLWLYRHPPASVSPSLKRLLVALRVAAVVVLALALAEPILSLTRTVTERPVVAVLVDSSRSMAIRDGTAGALRGDEAMTLLNEIVLPRLAHDAEIRAFAFSGESTELPIERSTVERPGSFDGEATDIGGAFQMLAREMTGRNLGAVVLATDGAVNRGQSPYEEGIGLGVPVFTLGLGSSESGPDIAVREVTTNRISYAGESLPIRVRVSSVGFGEMQTIVELREGNTLLDTRTLTLSATGEETELTFRVVPGSPGVHRYTVSIPEAPSELSSANNIRVTATNAVKGRIKALLLTSRPGWDYAFLGHELEADGNVDVTTLALVRGAETLSEPRLPSTRAALFEYDLIILSAPYDRLQLEDDWLRGFVEDRGGGLMVVGSAISGLTDILPVVASEASAGGPANAPAGGPANAPAGGARETRARLTGEGEISQVMRVAGDRMANVELWRSLPPVWMPSESQWEPTPDADVLLAGTGALGEDIPLVVSAKRGAGGVIVVAADGIWRWKLSGPDDVDLFDRFLANSARWLTARGELNRAVAGTDKDVYSTGETVRLSAQVYGDDFRLTRDALVTADIARGEGAAPVRSLSLGPDGDFYRIDLEPLAPGRYLYEAAAEVAGEIVGSARGEFIIEEFSLEDSEVRRRPALLRKLGEESGGGYFTPETLDRFPDSVPLAWTTRLAAREIELWDSPWLLTAFVGILGVEWTLRRRKGLP